MNDQESRQIHFQFDEIEKRVEQLFKKIESLETANIQLKNRITQLEQEVKEKTEAEERFAEEKALIRSKIDALLEKINHFRVLDSNTAVEEPSGDLHG